MYYKDYETLCEADGLKPDRLLSLLELERAKERAVEMAKARKRLDTSKRLSPSVRQQMETWIKKQDEERIEHMIIALEMAESMDGLGNGLELFLKNKWKSWGMILPNI